MRKYQTKIRRTQDIHWCLTILEYKNHLTRLGNYLLWKFCYPHGVKTSKNWNEVHPQFVVEWADVAILCNFSIHTDWTAHDNRLDIIIKDRKGTVCTLIDLSVPTKWKKLCRWKSKTVHFVVGTLVLITNGIQE